MLEVQYISPVLLPTSVAARINHFTGGRGQEVGLVLEVQCISPVLLPQLDQILV